MPELSAGTESSEVFPLGGFSDQEPNSKSGNVVRDDRKSTDTMTESTKTCKSMDYLTIEEPIGGVPFEKQLEWKDKPYRTRKLRSQYRGEILHEVKLSENLFGVHSVKIDPTGEQVVLGFGSGEIQVRDLFTGGNNMVIRRGKKNSVPVTSLKFLPCTSNLVFSGTCCGKILLCDLSKITHKKFATEPKNEINCMDINRSGEMLISGGKDAALRIYNVTTEKLQTTLVKDRCGRNSKPMYHNMRIYSIKFHPQQSDVFFSGGWDDCIKCWDTRVPNYWIRNIHGPRICGESIDVNDTNHMVTGSWTTEKSLQLWDWRTGSLLGCISPLNRATSIDGEFVYGIKYFLKDNPTDKEYVLAGSSGTGSLEVIEITDRRVVGSFTSPKSIRAFDAHKSRIVYGGIDKSFIIAEF